ncbi:Calx-beta domain-containing protein [Planctomycetaceae bacterium SH139]
MPRLPFSKRHLARQTSSRRSRAGRNPLFRRSLVASLETLESRQLLAADVTLFADSFEAGSNSNDWASSWVEDSQNDWFRSSQRATDGSRSAEVDGWASNATLKLSDPIDLSGYSSAELTFDWLIESGFDSGEYVALDISSDGGATWNTSVRQINGNSDPENQWRSETVDLTPYASSNLVIQFRAKVSRSNEDANVDNVKITGQQSEPTFPATISYPDFSDSSGLTLLGDAAVADGNTLRLTPAVEGVNGAVWHENKQFVSVDWETSFDFNLNENVGDVGGSDGFAFIIQNHAPTYLAGGGGRLGYDALPNSLVVEFDTFQNSEPGDPSQSHISVHTNGTGPNSWEESLSIGSFDTPSLMDDATTHSVTVRYVSGQLQVFYDSLAAPVISADVDLSELLNLDSGKAWVGFTAATGGGYQNHDILNWEYRVLADTSRTVAISNTSVVEGNGGVTDLTFDIVRSGDTSQPATLDWSIVGGSATSGVDYSNDSGTLSFAADEDVKSIVVGVNGDLAEEDDETLRIQIENLSSGVLVVDSATGTILNDDTSISISDATVTEGDGTLSLLGSFVSEGSGGLSRPRLSTFGPDGNSDGIQDFYIVSVANNQILRYDGADGTFIDAFVSDEPLFDNGIGLAFSPQNGDLYAVSGPSVLRFDGASGNLVETVVSGLDNPAGVAFFESGPRFGDLLITERTTDKVLIFDGTSVSDFVSSGSGGLNNPRNAVVGPDGDVYVASRDTLQVLKYSGDNGAFVGIAADIPLSSVAYIEFGDDGLLYASGRTTGVGSDTSLLQIDPESGTILQTLPLGRDGWSFTVGPDNVVYSSGNGSGNYVDRIGPASNAAFSIELSKPSALPVSVDFASVNVTAIAGDDYSASSGSIVFEPGVISRTLLVSTLDDELTENDEQFRVDLSGAANASLSTSSAIGTIQDDGDTSNQPPVVDAGSDQTLSDNDGTGLESVTLVGVASDSDGTIDSVEWTLGGVAIGNSQNLTTDLPVGTHTLTFTATDDGGLSSSDTVEVTVVANQGPSADAGVDQSITDSDGDGFETVTLVGTGTDDDGSIVSYEWSDGANVIGTTASITPQLAVGTHTLTLTVTDNGGATETDAVSVTVEAATTGPKLSHGNVAAVGSTWQTVSLGETYDSAVIVATPRYNNGSGPGVVRVSNVTATSFDVRVDNVGSTAFSGGVHFIAMEEGVYDVPGEYKLEAVKVDASTTSGKSGGWQIGSQGYQQSYSSPVVVGQVMSANDADWSVFWSSSSSRTSPANSSSLNIGKHVGEDTDTTRATETLGYFVIESTSSGAIDGLSFSAGVGTDSIRGVDNGTYRYSNVTPAGAATAVLSTAGMDGGDGGWAALMGSTPLSASGSIDLSIDEDQVRDSERNHTTEQVAYLVIGEPAGEGEASALATPPITVHNPLDVNGDGFTSPIDALQVINALNTKHESLVAYDEGDNALDTNGDGNISPIDALLVINKLNANNSAPATNSDAASIVDGYFADFEDEEETLFDLDLV